jgi:hypothetical protein
MSLPSVLQTAAACVLTILSVSAAPEAKPVRHARFLAVGDIPPFRQEIRDGIRYELDPPADSVPPREIVLGFGKKITDALTLRLGRITEPVEIPEGEGNLDLRRVGDDLKAAPWLSFKRPETGDFLVYLFRSPSKKTWNDAVGLIIPDGPVGSPAGTVRVVNLYPLAIRVVWAAEGIMLPAGKNILRTIQPGTEVPFQILVPDQSGAMKRYYSGAVTQNPNERGLVTIYRADGENPRRPVKVSMLREPVAPPPPPKKK